MQNWAVRNTELMGKMGWGITLKNFISNTLKNVGT